MTFYQRLNQAWQDTGSLLCVGIDPQWSALDDRHRAKTQPFLSFIQDIVQQVAGNVCAVKFQFAHFAAEAREHELLDAISFVKHHFPKLVVILDAKRGDIGSTAAYYQQEAFQRYAADAVTLNPYLGYDSVQSFAEQPDRGCIYLCRTSNPGSDEFQSLVLQAQPPKMLYEQVATNVVTRWNHQNAMLVVGATHVDAIRKVRRIDGNIPLLVPGIGQQGGDLDAVLRAGLTANGSGLLLSASRSIIEADDPTASAQALNAAINRYRTHG